MNTRPRHASESGLDAATAVADCSAGEKLLQSEYRAAARSGKEAASSKTGGMDCSLKLLARGWLG